MYFELSQLTMGHQLFKEMEIPSNVREEYYKNKKRVSLGHSFKNKYGSYLLSRILVQYHRP